MGLFSFLFGGQSTTITKETVGAFNFEDIKFLLGKVRNKVDYQLVWKQLGGYSTSVKFSFNTIDTILKAQGINTSEWYDTHQEKIVCHAYKIATEGYPPAPKRDLVREACDAQIDAYNEAVKSNRTPYNSLHSKSFG